MTAGTSGIDTVNEAIDRDLYLIFQNAAKSVLPGPWSFDRYGDDEGDCIFSAHCAPPQISLFRYPNEWVGYFGTTRISSGEFQVIKSYLRQEYRAATCPRLYSNGRELGFSRFLNARVRMSAARFLGLLLLTAGISVLFGLFI